MGNIGLPEVLLLLIVVSFLSLAVVWPAWRVIARMGFPGPIALVALLPLGGYLLLVIFAIIDWPVHKEVRALQERLIRQ